jgi:hypothetical protein
MRAPRFILSATLVAVALTISLAAQKTTELKVGKGGSPHVRTDWTIDGAQISVEYGRPYLKGRTIFGGLHKSGEVWRIGADEATTLKTSAPLVIGGTAVPAGTYTLWALLGDKDWKLIINKTTGVWGVPYKYEATELGRVDMKLSKLPAKVDQVTISIAQGELRVEWDDTRASTPLAV